MIARTVVPLIAAVAAAGVLTSAPANADPVDDSFLSALNNAGVGYNDPATAVNLGQQVCPMLVEPGKNFASVATKLRGDGGLSPEMASFFAGIAISMYCPQMMSQIGDGTLLRMLTVPGLGGFTGLRP
ncbi:DUF732 domain-containing protein [Mycolicibacterium wolinskyi]|uniref:DUF732 domain-containing protein n=1 Tax=Mycolicibacterium wolinskyi TaxID=59750 RepID=UPI0039176A0D